MRPKPITPEVYEIVKRVWVEEAPLSPALLSTWTYEDHRVATVRVAERLGMGTARVQDVLRRYGWK